LDKTLLSNDNPECDFLNPIDNAWMLLKEVTLEDLRQAARTGGLPATPERIQAARGRSGIPAALAGIEPFQRFGDGQTSGTAGQPMAERIMAAQRGRLNEFGQPHEEGYDPAAYKDLPDSVKNEMLIDEVRHDDDPELPVFDDSMPDPMTVQPPEVTSSMDAGFFPKTLQGLQADNPEAQKRFAQNYDFNMRMGGPARNRRRDYYGNVGEEYGPIVQNPRNYGRSHSYDPFSFKNRIQTQEPVDDTEFADDSRPETMPQMQQLGQSLADFPEFPEGVQPDPDAGRRQFEAQANRARSLAAQSAQPSTASPMDAAMQALGNRKTEEAARVPKPVQRRALNTRRGGRGRGPNSRRNRRR
jgi:hypothetical protein